MYKFGIILLLIVALPLAVSASEAESITVELKSGNEITVEKFGQGPARLLWIPAGYGLEGSRKLDLAKALAASNLEVWVVNLHDTYFIAPGRTSLSEVPIEDVAQLIDHVRHLDDKRLYLFSSERGASLGLIAANQWIQHHPKARPIDGAILLYPNLTQTANSPGQPPQYYPVVDTLQLPIYIIQPASSAKRWHLQALKDRLHAAGSQVYSQIIQGVGDGFHARPEPSDLELERAAELPDIVHRAMNLLKPIQPKLTRAAKHEDASLPIPAIKLDLQPVQDHPDAQPLTLTDLNGQTIDLEAYRGEVIVLNFWATWCPPCVEEIPSLGRLNDLLKGDQFELISVDIGEDPETVKQFLAEIPANFPVLLDPEGTSVIPWRLQAFPTTFVIDRGGRLSHGYVGGLNWDDPQVVQLLQSLMDE